MPISLSKIFFG